MESLLPEDEEANDYYSSDEDDEKWMLDHDVDPLVNVVTFGWVEDGRLGYPAEEEDQLIQLNPKPVAHLRVQTDKLDPHKETFICKSASAGSRHTVFLMIDCAMRKGWKSKEQLERERLEALEGRSSKKHSSAEEEREKHVKLEPRKLKVLLTGLNQVGLCEEKGHELPYEVPFELEGDVPAYVHAGKGNTFIITKQGRLYSFGYGRFGALGLGDCEFQHTPTLVRNIAKKCVVKISAGFSHTFVMTDKEELFGWGRNNKGQIGVGAETDYELTPSNIVFKNVAKYRLIDFACGAEHTIAVIGVKNKEGFMENMAFAWGDESRGQLGSGDAVSRSRPQENRWLTRFMKNRRIRVQKVAAGGFHNILLLKYSGQLIAWGANDYGQLGNGFQFDDPYPRIINNVKSVIMLSAGLRHNVAVSERESLELLTWGYNGYGELGLGDTNIRLQPTKVTAVKNTKIFSVSAGDRHTVVVTSHKPITAKEDVQLQPYFRIYKSANGNKAITKRLKHSMVKQGLDPEMIEKPDLILPDQIGSNDVELKNDMYEKGLRYCMDTFCEEFDWRRKALETCFECITKTHHLKSVCLACARNCLANEKLRPHIRFRKPKDICDCRISGLCVCSWSKVRAAFDKLIDEDKCIGPNQVRELLRALRAPYPVENADVEDCLLNLAEGREDEYSPRIGAVPFEKWYRKYYDEQKGGDDDDEKSRASTLRSDSTYNKKKLP